MKQQETLEEAAKKYVNKKGDISTTELEDAIFKQGFIDGAKWQQERMYSEEDLKQFAFECVANFLSNRENKIEIKLLEVISDRNNELFGKFKNK